MALGQRRPRDSGAALVGAIYSQIGVNSLDLSAPDRVRPRSVEQSYKLFEERRCMIMRWTVKAVAATGILGLAMVSLAAPSHADTTVTFSGDLSDPGNAEPLTGGTFSPGIVAGPTVMITLTATFGGNPEAFWVDAPGVLTNLSGQECSNATGLCEVNPDAPTITLNVDPGADGANVRLYVVEGGPLVDGGFTVTYAASSESGSAGGAGPAPHIQQFPRPAAGTCDEAEPEGVNWSGVASGSWGESWAKWMNDGEGGDVCTRTLIYNQSKAAWEVD